MPTASQRAGGDRRPLPFPLHGLVVPPVVIAENGVHAERRPQAGKHARPLAGGNVARHLAVPGHVVAEHDDHVRLERVGARDDVLDAIERHPGIAGVQVRDRSDPEMQARGPFRRRNMIARNAKPQHRRAEPVGGGGDTPARPTLPPMNFRKRRRDSM